MPWETSEDFSHWRTVKLIDIQRPVMESILFGNICHELRYFHLEIFWGEIHKVICLGHVLLERIQVKNRKWYQSVVCTHKYGPFPPPCDVLTVQSVAYFLTSFDKDGSLQSERLDPRLIYLKHLPIGLKVEQQNHMKRVKREVFSEFVSAFLVSTVYFQSAWESFISDLVATGARIKEEPSKIIRWIGSTSASR